MGVTLGDIIASCWLSDLSAIQWIGLAFASVCFLALLRSGRREAGLPPGPPTIPFFGNLHLLRQSFIRISDWDLFHELLPKYGPVMSFKLGSKTAIILQDDGAAFRELFEKRGAIYNARPVHTVNSYVFDGDNPVWENNPYKYKTNRRLSRHHFHHRMKADVVALQEAESTQLLADLAETPSKHNEHLLRFTTSVLTTLIYGYRTPTKDHFAVCGLLHILRERHKIFSPNTPPVDYWPWLQYLPEWILPWREPCRKVMTITDNALGLLTDMSRKLLDEGLLDQTTFAYKVFSEQGSHQMRDHWAMMILWLVLDGGTDVLARSLETIILALLTHPHVQAKARVQVDSVCDEETIPGMNHYEKLTYIRCIAKEALRWRPLFPLGVPHAVEQDDEYLGYKIPKDATIVQNIWAIHQNPERYPEPEKFMPERFENHPLMTGDYMSFSDYRARDHFAFGPGRRSCPGVYIAEQAQILVTAKLLWAFEILPDPAAPAVPNDMRTAFFEGPLSGPKPFPFVLKPRSEKRLQVIEREMERLKEGGGVLAERQGLLGEVERTTSLPEGYAWKPRDTQHQMKKTESF